MIVDLLRNDLSRVCTAHSVEVPALCDLESYASVHHLVSVITGKLVGEHDAVTLLRACFPGGSVTGAPKVRSMEIIAEIERIAREAYCGAIGFMGFNGCMDSEDICRRERRRRAASGPNLTLRFAWGFPEELACASLGYAQANEYPVEPSRP